LVGDGALEYALVLCSFHSITRLADLLGVKPEAPEPLRRIEALRRLVVRVGGLWLRIVGLAGPSYSKSYEQALEDIRPVFEETLARSPDDDFEALRSRPQILEAIQRLLEEQVHRSSLGRTALHRVHRIVEDSLLPVEDTPAMSALPQTDPISTFVELGTRYPYQTTAASVQALRETGLDDLGILDLAVAIGDANMWARLYRLLGLPPELYYLGDGPWQLLEGGDYTWHHPSCNDREGGLHAQTITQTSPL